MTGRAQVIEFADFWTGRSCLLANSILRIPPNRATEEDRSAHPFNPQAADGELRLGNLFLAEARLRHKSIALRRRSEMLLLEQPDRALALIDVRIKAVTAMRPPHLPHQIIDATFQRAHAPIARLKASGRGLDLAHDVVQEDFGFVARDCRSHGFPHLCGPGPLGETLMHRHRRRAAQAGHESRRSSRHQPQGDGAGRRRHQKICTGRLRDLHHQPARHHGMAPAKGLLIA